MVIKLIGIHMITLWELTIEAHMGTHMIISITETCMNVYLVGIHMIIELMVTHDCIIYRNSHYCTTYGQLIFKLLKDTLLCTWYVK